MYGHLVPSSGGEALPLRKTRMFLGRVKGSGAPLCRDNAYCQLELIEGFWHIEDLNTPQGLKVNGRTCKRQRLMPEDEITIGRHRYRISFEAPRYAGVQLIEGPALVPADRQFFCDGIHPNNAGMAAIARALTPALSRLLAAR